MNGILNLINFIMNNWTLIGAVIIIILVIINSIKNFHNKSKNEKIAIAKKQIKETILKWVSEAETDYEDLVKAGEIKRAQVIQNIYNEYPILKNVIEQEELIKYIDECINKALEKLREIIETNENSFVIK